MPTVIVTSIEEARTNDGDTATMRLLVTGVSAGDAADCRDALAAANYSLGQSYTGAGGGGVSGITLSNLSYSPVEDSGGTIWQATASYSSDDESESPATYSKIESSTKAEVVDVWRIGATADNINTPGATYDIGGTGVDARGVPVSALVVQQELTYTVQHNFTTTDQATVNGMIGTRNSALFLGGNAGYVLFTGVRRSRIAVNLYEVTYTFVWDAAAHLRQIPDRDADGEPIISVGGAYDKKAKYVYARQPFPTLSDFSTLPGIS